MPESNERPTREEVRQIIAEVLLEQQTMTRADVRDVVRETVEDIFLILGIDASTPLTVQQDMHFIRELRTASETVRSRGLLVLVGILITAAAGALWLGIRGAISS